MKVQSLVLFFVIGIFAQLNAQLTTAPSISLENPYNTMYVHLHFLQDDSYEPAKAAKTIYPDVDSLEAVNYAVKLKQILDGKGLYVYLNQVPQQNDYMDSISMQNYYYPFREQLPGLYLERINTKWYYSKGSIDLIPKMYNEVFPYGTDRLINLLPKKGHQRFLGLALWQYLGLFILMGLGLIFHFILSRVIQSLEGFILQGWIKKLNISKEHIWSIAKILSLLLIFRLLANLLPVLQLPANYSSFGIKIFNIISICLFALLAIRLVQIFVSYGKSLALKTSNRMDEQLLPIIDRFLKIVIIVFSIIQILRILDVNVTALIAGISIGGLALALAAQDTVKNLIGSVLIFIDRPFQIGDYVVGSDYEGTIEEVGFRSTRIRTSDTSLVSVPNGNISNAAVKNLGARYLRLFSKTIAIANSTNSKQIEMFTESLIRLIRLHPKSRQDMTYYAHLVSIEQSAVLVKIQTFINVDSFATELKVKEDFLINITKLCEELDIIYANPNAPLLTSNTNTQKEKDEDYEKKLYDFFQEYQNNMEEKYKDS
jgi:MscS family membrane protein